MINERNISMFVINFHMIPVLECLFSIGKVALSVIEIIIAYRDEEFAILIPRDQSMIQLCWLDFHFRRWAFCLRVATIWCFCRFDWNDTVATWLPARTKRSVLLYSVWVLSGYLARRPFAVRFLLVTLHFMGKRFHWRTSWLDVRVNWPDAQRPSSDHNHSMMMYRDDKARNARCEFTEIQDAH